jgi:hypothetical protein
MANTNNKSIKVMANTNNKRTRAMGNKTKLVKQRTLNYFFCQSLKRYAPKGSLKQKKQTT